MIIDLYKDKVIEEILACLAEPVSDGGIPVGVSNRHLHVSQEDLAVLFGEGHVLVPVKSLSQTGQFAAKETVCITGPKGCFNQVRILGPVREKSQVEISRSDAFALGIKPPVRISGDLQGAAGICVIGPAGMLVMKENVIIAKRHIHMSPEDAHRFRVSDGACVAVASSGEKECVFKAVSVRVSRDAVLELHIDTDEANAADLKNGMKVKLA